MEFIEYLVKQGDRWDTIAYEMYGDPYLYETIITANRQYLGLPYPPAGAILQIRTKIPKPAKIADSLQNI